MGLGECQRGDGTPRPYAVWNQLDLFHRAAGRDRRLIGIVDDDEVVAAAVLQPPLAADKRRLADVAGGEWRQPAPLNAIGPTMVLKVRGGDCLGHRIAIAGIVDPAHHVDASSNRACTKPMGWVHCLPVARCRQLATSPALSPLSEDLNGWLGDHQTSRRGCGRCHPAPRRPAGTGSPCRWTRPWA
jgi:hypothetical protein